MASLPNTALPEGPAGLDEPVLLNKISPLDCGPLGIDCPARPTGANIASFIFSALGPFLTLAFIIFVVAVVYSGILYVSSAGEEDRARRAKLVLVFAIMGLLIVIGIAGIVVNVFLNTFPVPTD